MLNTINFENIILLLETIDINDDISFFSSNLLCYFLRTGDYKCFQKEARKIIKKVNFDELLIDIQATLMLHDSIKSLISNNKYESYNTNYWSLLYSNMPSTSDNYAEFIKQYKKNFNEVLMANSPIFSIIIYSCLEETLAYIDKNINCNFENKKSMIEYINAMKIPSIVLMEKENLGNDKKSAFKLLQKNKGRD